MLMGVIALVPPAQPEVSHVANSDKQSTERHQQCLPSKHRTRASCRDRVVIGVCNGRAAGGMALRHFGSFAGRKVSVRVPVRIRPMRHQLTHRCKR